MKPTQQTSEKVLVGLGSGVGSLVVAWLLKKQGRQLRGVYFDFLQDPARTQWVQQIEKKLGIPVQILDVTDELEANVVLPWLEARKLGVDVSMRKLFQRSILFPKLFELKKSHHFDKVATGHYAVTQYDTLDKVMRIMRSVETDRDEAHFLLGLSQEEIQSLELPLGSIPLSMSEKIAIELGMDTVEPLRSHPVWTRLQQFALSKMGNEGNRTFDVYTLEGDKAGSVTDGINYSIGDEWTELKEIPNSILNPEATYYVYQVNVSTGRIVIGTLDKRVLTKLTLKSLFWFNKGNLNVKGMQCSMIWRNPKVTAPVKVIEFEGNRARAYLETPLKKTEADVFPGQTVLWLSGSEILGGGEVTTCE